VTGLVEPVLALHFILSAALPSQAHPEGMNYLLFILMFGAGIYLFVRGFKVYWEFRVFRNLPVSSIRGLAMGLVRVRGRATGVETLLSPVTRQPCYYYSLRVAKWETDHKNRHYWRRWSRDSDQVKFYLEDETGKVLLNPREADLELDKTFQQIIDGELPDNLITFSHQRELSGPKAGAEAMPAPEAAAERDQLELIGALARGGAKGETGRFRLIECCITPDTWYQVTGTCTPNPLAKDDADRNQIKKGAGESFFVITDKESFERTLDRRAVASIFGGAFLTVLSAALMLLYSRTG
jgi:hypothetical protein